MHISPAQEQPESKASVDCASVFNSLSTQPVPVETLGIVAMFGNMAQQLARASSSIQLSSIQANRRFDIVTDSESNPL